MLQDYGSAIGLRYVLSWEDFAFSASIDEYNAVVGLHDQDFIHNGKKLINPLDSSVRVLQLGGEVCCLEQVGQVYNKFSFDQHGLWLEDISRTDRQN
jgi:hypothetical protein